MIRDCLTLASRVSELKHDKGKRRPGKLVEIITYATCSGKLIFWKTKL